MIVLLGGDLEFMTMVIRKEGKNNLKWKLRATIHQMNVALISCFRC